MVRLLSWKNKVEGYMLGQGLHCLRWQVRLWTWDLYGYAISDLFVSLCMVETYISCWTAWHSLFLKNRLHFLCPNCPVEVGSVIDGFNPCLQWQTVQYKQCIMLCEFVKFFQDITWEPTISTWNICKIGHRVEFKKMSIIFSVICVDQWIEFLAEWDCCYLSCLTIIML
jgi:hypothetical protein